MKAFPNNFLWGSATSAHQVEGGNANNDWSLFEQQGKINDGTVSGSACDHYNRFLEDFNLIQQLGHNAFRLSLEWSRIEPRCGFFDVTAIRHYRTVLEQLKKRDITTFVTLHHFTNPLWFARSGGWRNAKAAEYFSRYVDKVVSEVGELVDFWLTINEPLVSISAGYLSGYWPPEQKSFWQAISVFRHLLQAHKKSFQIIHTHLPKAQVGLALHHIFFQSSHSNRFLKITSEKIATFVWNHLWYRLSRKYYDFLGVNYYFRVQLPVRRKAWLEPPQFLPPYSHSFDSKKLIIENNPRSLLPVLLDLKRYKLPIFITEHGVADADDVVRERVISDAVAQIEAARQRGVNVRGYLHWSLLDNFEWREGKSMRFGLVTVDYKTQRRTIRPSALVFQKIIQKN